MINTDAIAIAILNDDEIDFIDAYCSISSILLDPAEILNLANALEICPIHRCDINICIDDEITECSEYH